MHKNENILKIINNLEPKIKNHTYSTSYNERENLSQEVKIKIIEKLNVLLEEDTPDFWEFLERIS